MHSAYLLIHQGKYCGCKIMKIPSSEFLLQHLDHGFALSIQWFLLRVDCLFLNEAASRMCHAHGEKTVSQSMSNSDHGNKRRPLSLVQYLRTQHAIFFSLYVQYKALYNCMAARHIVMTLCVQQWQVYLQEFIWLLTLNPSFSFSSSEILLFRPTFSESSWKESINHKLFIICVRVNQQLFYS